MRPSKASFGYLPSLIPASRISECARVPRGTRRLVRPVLESRIRAFRGINGNLSQARHNDMSRARGDRMNKPFVFMVRILLLCCARVSKVGQENAILVVSLISLVKENCCVSLNL